MSDVRVFVITSDKYMWAMRPFAHLFNKYWGEDQEVVVAGCSLPNFELPLNFRFHSLRRADYPPEQWSDGFIKLLNDMPDEYFVFMLEDYWIQRHVDKRFVNVALKYMRQNPNDILKIDLTNDRLHARGDARDAIDFCNIGPYDIIVSPTDLQYRMSLQSALWNKNLMLKILEKGKTPWEVEIHINPPSEMYVLGSRQWPLRYVNAVYKGDIDQDEVAKLSSEDQKVIYNWIPKGWSAPNVKEIGKN